MPSALTWCSCIASRSARLGLGRRPVDLVGQHEVGEHRALAELEPSRRRVEHDGARDVGGQQVGGELDAAEGQAGDGGQRAHSERLGHAGEVVEQHVAVGQQPGQHQLEHGALADDGPLDLVEDGRRPRRRVGEAEGDRARAQTVTPWGLRPHTPSPAGELALARLAGPRSLRSLTGPPAPPRAPPGRWPLGRSAPRRARHARVTGPSSLAAAGSSKGSSPTPTPWWRAQAIPHHPPYHPVGGAAAEAGTAGPAGRA